MTRFEALPSTFAIVRTAGYRGPQFQILTSHCEPWNNHPFGDRGDEPYNIVEEWVGQYDDGPYRLEQPRNNETDRRIYQAKYRNPITNDVLEVKYWYLPFVLEVGIRRVPLLEFQYRSWIPHSQRTIEVDLPMSMTQFMSIFERIQRDRLDDIRDGEDRVMTTNERRFQRALSRYPRGPDDYDDRLNRNERYVGAGGEARMRYMDRPPSPVPPRIIEVPVERVVRVPVDRVVIQTRVAPLPKTIGDILISNARKGADSCPIVATPYSECDSLSITSCFHIFDGPSLTRWCEDHTSCPVCRTKIENIITETRGDAVSTV